MKRLLVLVLAACLLGSMAFAQGLPRGATAWEYAFLVVNVNPVNRSQVTSYTWYAYGVPDGIQGDFESVVAALASQYRVDLDAMRENQWSGPLFVLNLVGFAGWELLSEGRTIDFGAEFWFKRPRR
jgi:hypothetical protein